MLVDSAQGWLYLTLVSNAQSMFSLTLTVYSLESRQSSNPALVLYMQDYIAITVWPTGTLIWDVLSDKTGVCEISAKLLVTQLDKATQNFGVKQT